jgi:hypothetical protein
MRGRPATLELALVLAELELWPPQMPRDTSAAAVLPRHGDLCSRLAVAQQCPRARLDPQRPVAARGRGCLRQMPHGIGGSLGLPGPGGGLDELSQSVKRVAPMRGCRRG